MKFSHLMPFAAALMLSTAAVAQDTTQPTPATPAATEPAPTTPTPGPAPSELPSATPAPAEIPAPRAETTTPVLTDDQARALRNKVVWSSDQMKVGEVADVVRDRDGRIQELHADIGGFLGFGETRVRVAPDEFRMMDDRIVLTRTKAQVELLPKVIEN